jgi:cystathionine gamma-synthase
MYQKTPEVLGFDRRLAKALESQIQVGDFLQGSWPKGASVKLPPSGDGGRSTDYARQAHPGGERVEKFIKTLEMGDHALLFSDGMRAIAAATEVVVRPGDTVFVHSSLYGGTIRYFNSLKEWGVNVQFVDLSSDDAGAKIFESKPKLLVLESVTNPLLHVLDMPALMRAASRADAFMIIDNTLPTAYGCVPLDIARQNEYDKLMVALSITKGYTAGVLGGAVVTDNDELGEKLFRYRQAKGGNASPNDVPHYYDGIKTMGPRMERLTANTLAIVDALTTDPTEGIKVLYPFIKGVKDYQRAQELLLRAPGVFTLECAVSPERYASLIGRLEKLFIRSNSFNGVNPQLSESTKQSHAGVKSADQKREAGITTQLVRLSPSSTYAPNDIAGEMVALLDEWRSESR